jgi:hypothetical protein
LKQVDKLVVIELGAGIHIPTVRHESERRAGQHLIRINPRAAGIPDGHGISLGEGALAALSMIDEYINP